MNYLTIEQSFSLLPSVFKNIKNAPKGDQSILLQWATSISEDLRISDISIITQSKGRITIYH